MTNCLFNKFKDLVGIHQVIFDSVLADPTPESAIAGLRNSGYFDAYHTEIGLAGTDGTAEFLLDVKEAIEMSFDIIREFADDNHDLPGVSDLNTFLKATESYNLQGNIHEIFKDVSLRYPVAKPIAESLQLPQNTTEVKPNELSAGGTEISVTDQIKLNDTNVNEVISLENYIFRTTQDIVDNYYSGAKVAYDNFKRMLNREIFDNVLMLANTKNNNTTEVFNNNIRNIKNNLYAKLVNDPGAKLYDSHYTNDKLGAALAEVRKSFTNFGGTGITVGHLIRWSQTNMSLGKIELDRYNAMVALTHFDDLIHEFSNKMIQVRVHKGIETDADKYGMGKISNHVTDWTQASEDISSLQAASELYKTIIGTTQLLDLNGTPTSDILSHVQVNYSFSKILRKVNTINPSYSIRETIIKTLKNYYDTHTLGQGLDKQDIRALLSLYDRAFRDNSAKVEELGSNSPYLKNPTGNTSIFDNFKNFEEEGVDALNYYHLVALNLLKNDSVNYTEVMYDTADKTLTFRSFLNKEANMQRNILKQLGFTAMLNPGAVANYMQKYGFDVKGDSVLYNLIDGRTLSYNTYTNAYSILQPGLEPITISSKDLHNVIEVPKDNQSIGSISDLKQNYPDYNNILKLYEEVLEQPMSINNYKLVDAMRDALDTKANPAGHLNTILNILSNGLYLRVLDSMDNGLQGAVNKPASEIRNRIEAALKTLGSKHSFDDLWDDRNRRYRIEMSKKGDKNFQIMQDYARVLNDYFSTRTRSVTINSEGNAVSTYRLMSMVNRYHAIQKQASKNHEGPYGRNPLKNNLFVLSDNHDLIKSIEINSGFRLSDSASSSAAMSFDELVESKFNANFITGLAKGKEGEFLTQPAEYSDKSTHSLLNISRGKQFSYYDGTLKKTSLHEADSETLKRAFFASQYDYYNAKANIVKAQFMQILDNTNGQSMLYDVFLDNAKYVTKYFRKLPDSVDVDTALRQKLEQLNSKGIGLKGWEKEFKTEIETYFKLKAPVNIGTKSPLEAFNDLIWGVSPEMLRQAFNNMHIPYIKQETFETLRDKNYAEINASLMNNLKQYKFGTPENKKYIKEVEAAFLEKAIEGKLKLNLFNDRGEPNNMLRLAMDNLPSNDRMQLNMRVEEIAKDRMVATTDFTNHKTGRLELAKYDDKGNIIKLNPLLTKFLWESNLLNRNFHQLIVGSPTAHPHKVEYKEGETTPWHIDAGRFGSQNKRMVAPQATMHMTLTNTLKGISLSSRVFTIADRSSPVFSAYGKTDKVDVTDGSTLILPTHTILFNNSLQDAAAGDTLKSIRIELDPATGDARLLKHAAHTITNRNIKNGYGDGKNDYLSLAKKGLEYDFTNITYGINNEQSFTMDVDLTKRFNGRDNNILQEMPLHFTMPAKSQLRTHALEGWNYNDLVHVSSFVKVEGQPNTYRITYENKNTGAKVTDTAVITTSWALWNALGAENSVEQHQDEIGKFSETKGTILDGYLPSDTSWRALVAFTNDVGVRVDELEAKDEASARFVDYYKDVYLLKSEQTPLDGETKLYDQTNIFQPLKFVQVSEFVFESAYKVGPKNIVTMDEMRDENKQIPYSIANNSHYGIQQDSGHEVDGSQVVEQTQIISAFDFVGDSPEIALRAFTAISTYVSNSLANLLPRISGYASSVEDQTKVREIIRKILISALDTKDITGIDTALVAILKREADNGELPTFKVPLSSPDFYNSVVTAFGNYFTKNGIRRKLAGIGAILKPYSGFMQFHEIEENGVTKLVSGEEFIKFKERNPGVIITDYDKTQRVTLKSTVIEYKDVNGVLEEVAKHKLDTLSKYNKIKAKMLANPELFKIDSEAPRDLKGLDFEIEIGGVNYSFHDLPVNLLTNLNSNYVDTKAKLDRAETQLALDMQVAEDYNLDQDFTIQSDQIEAYKVELAEIVNQFEETKAKITGVPTLDINSNVTYVLPEIIKNLNVSDKLNGHKALNLLKNLSTRDHKLLHYGYSRIPALAQYDDIKDLELFNAETLKPLGKVSSIAPTYNDLGKISALNAVVKMTGFKGHAAETLAPNVHLSAFGLSQLHTPNNVTVETFEEILNAKNGTLTDMYDAVLKSVKGDDLYLLYEGSETHKQLLNSGALLPNTSVRIDKVGSNYYIVDRQGELSQQVPGPALYASISSGTTINYMVIERDDAVNSRINGTLKAEGSLYHSYEPNFENVSELHLDFYAAKQEGVFNYGKAEAPLKRAALFANPDAAVAAGLDVVKILKEDNYGIAWVTDLLDSLNAHISESSNPSKFLIDRAKYAENLLNALQTGNDFQITKAFTQVNDSLSYSNSSNIQYDKDKAILLNSQRALEQSKRERNKYLAKKLYSSFVNTLKVSSARIPAQHLQSWMGMQIVAFTNDEENISYVAPEHMWITGEDFDIDKAYISAYVLGNDGRIARWTKFWADDTPELLALSLQLPTVSPNADVKIFKPKTVKFKTRPNIRSLSTEAIQTVIKHKYALLSSNTEGATVLIKDGKITTEEDGAEKLKFDAIPLADYKIIVDTLNNVFTRTASIQDSDLTEKYIYVNEDLTPEIQQEFLDLMNHYFNNTYLSEDLGKTGSLNAIVSGMVNTGTDVRNVNTQMSPVDFGESEELAKNSAKGKAMSKLSYDNPFDIDFVQVSAMYGKEVIGISATTLKGYGFISHLQSRIKETGVGPALFFNTEVEAQGEYFKSYIETVNIDNDIEIENIANWLLYNLSDYWGLDPAEVDVARAQIENLKRKIQERNHSRTDIALAFSGILSAATDNAKEMILGRINAGPATAPYYLAGSLAGFPMRKVYEYMTSNEAESILNYSARNLFKGKPMTYKTARKKLLNDRFSIKEYIDDYRTLMSLSSKILKFDSRLKEQARVDSVNDKKAIYVDVKGEKVRLDHYLALGTSVQKELEKNFKEGIDKADKDLVDRVRDSINSKLNLVFKNPAFAIDKFIRAVSDGMITEDQMEGVYKDLQESSVYEIQATNTDDLITHNPITNDPGVIDENGLEIEIDESQLDININEDQVDGDFFESFEGFESSDGEFVAGASPKENAEFQKSLYFLGRAIEDYQTVFAPARKAILERDASLQPGDIKFEDLELIASSLTLIGKFGGVNQGLKVRHEDSLKFVKSMYEFLIDNVWLSPNEDLERQFLEVKPIEMLDKYFNDSELRNLINALYKTPGVLNKVQEEYDKMSELEREAAGGPPEAKSKVNVMEIVTSVPHMAALANLAVKNHLLMHNSQLKSRFIDSALFKDRSMNKDKYKVISDFANDLIISLGLSHLPENLRTLTLRKGDSVRLTTTSETDNVPFTELAKDVNIDIGTPEGRLAFMSWFETVLIPNLKQGIIRNTDGTIDVTTNGENIKNKDLLNNEFIKYISTDVKRDRYRDEYYAIYTIRANTTARASIEEQNLVSKLISSFANLKDVTYDSKKVTDFFFLYNLLAYKGLNTKGSFGFLLHAVNDSLSDDTSILSNYYQILGELDMESGFNAEENYNPDDLIIRGLNTLDNSINVSKPAGPWHPPAISQTKPDQDGRFVTRYYKQVPDRDGDMEWVEIKSSHSSKILNIQKVGEAKEVYAEQAKKAMLRRKLSERLGKFVDIIKTNC